MSRTVDGRYLETDIMCLCSKFSLLQKINITSQLVFC